MRTITFLGFIIIANAIESFHPPVSDRPKDVVSFLAIVTMIAIVMDICEFIKKMIR